MRCDQSKQKRSKPLFFLRPWLGAPIMPFEMQRTYLGERPVIRLAAALCFSGLIAVPIAAAKTPLPAAYVTDCGDFLASIGKMPPHSSFASCQAYPDRQGKPFEATYALSGRDALKVEAYMARHFGLKRMKFYCCYWDSRATRFQDKNGREFYIQMTSEETVQSSRKNWAKIPKFMIIVKNYTEEI
jgi:hypothetical protein